MVEIKGLKELKARFNSMPETLKKEVSASIERGAQVFVRNAQRDAPVNKEKNGGNLRQGISYFPRPVTGLKAEIVSNALYSPYIEWGTITRVDVPPELQDYAIQFKGRGIRKNGGIYPHPFFFKQIPFAKEEIEKTLAAIIRDL